MLQTELPATGSYFSFDYIPPVKYRGVRPLLLMKGTLHQVTKRGRADAVNAPQREFGMTHLLTYLGAVAEPILRPCLICQQPQFTHKSPTIGMRCLNYFIVEPVLRDAPCTSFAFALRYPQIRDE